MAVSSTVQCLAATPPHPRVANLELRFPMSNDEIIAKFSAFLKSSQAQVGPRNKRIAIVESIVSTPGVLMPWQEMVQLCREHGIWNLVDAAHSIGHELDIDLSAAQPDFWVSVCGARLSDIVVAKPNILPGALIELSQVAICEAALCCPLRPFQVSAASSVFAVVF